MRGYIFLFILTLISSTCQGQLVNNGGTILIESNATLRVEANLINHTGSTIVNHGTLEVQNNLTNAGIFTSGDTSKITFVGSVQSDVTSGDATLRYIEMRKNDENITLLDEMKVSDTINFIHNNNRIKVGNNNLKMLASASIINAGISKYVETNGTGYLIKELNTNGTQTYEIGDAAHYSPVSCTINGSYYNDASVGTRVYVIDLTPKYVDATDVINREWQIVSTGITEYENTMTGMYNESDVQGVAPFIKGAYYASDWKFDNSVGDEVNHEVSATTTSNDVKLSGMNFFGKAELKVFLAGAYNMSTGSMSTALNGVLPHTTPYTVAPFNAPSETYTVKPVNATDWILVELRDASSPSIILGQKSAWLLDDGSIVGLDGNALRIKNGNPTSIVAIRHRNHLSIRTAVGIDVVNPMPFDFTNTAVFGTNPQKNFSGTYAMWPGNALADGFTRFSGVDNDADVIKNNIISHASNPFGSLTFSYSGYNNFDVNMDGIIKYSGANNDRDYIKNTIISHPSNPFGALTYTINQQF